ncbi:hypothetical protein FEF26_15000 [Nesterenkonia salmonea]|uniref:DUF1795 domain-containing protein n=1 Tax=Nesterenkonia salmonea TaxID=1804987 RepID=A0A5R9B6S4_9MICC|nr:hypothetical protein [Nesterenkonia salmonea]TLP92226.1 hypothetical protein FEF26_15000 [Nesterenkonia salmonea]
MPFELALPDSWVVDDSARGVGVIVVRDSEPGAEGFHSNVAITAADLGDRDVDVESCLADQRKMEAEFVEQLREYRLLFLGTDAFGLPPVPAVMRVASYVTGEGVAVMMHQYAFRRPGVEHSVTFTFAALDAPVLGPGVWGTAEGAQWRADHS